MKSVILNSENSSLIVTYNEWIDLKKSISVLYAKGKNTEGKEAEANKIEKELISASSDFKNFNNAQKITWKEIQNELKPRDIAIEFIQYNELLGNERIYSALIVTANRKYPLMVKICSERDIQSIIGTIQGNDLSYINKIYGKDYKAFQELYNVIWKPLEPHLNNVNNIYLSPTGLLHKISFSALKNPNNIYLCDQYKIHLMGSTGKLTEKNNTENISNYSIKLFGGVNFNKKEGDREVWSYLPGTLNEVESIYAKLKKKKIDVELFTDENASEKKFKTVASDCNILHIATHGFFYPDPDKIDKTFSVKDQSEQGDLAFRGGSDQYGMWSFVQNKNPLMRSGVVLSGANDVWLNTKQDSKNDGVLTAQEVATIDMRKTDLVVLSACETGLGDIKGSEGVYGLQRSFKMAGVKYIIMSLWQVPDKETSEFMSLFYKSVLKTNDIEQSFRITQLKMRKKYAPYYWAAFVLIE
jgi:CHAT domain-containing protein